MSEDVSGFEQAKMNMEGFVKDNLDAGYALTLDQMKALSLLPGFADDVPRWFYLAGMRDGYIGGYLEGCSRRAKDLLPSDN